MKKIIFSVLMSLFAFGTMAQEQRQRATPEQMAENQLKMMTEKLSLSVEQQEKIKALNSERSRIIQESNTSQGRDQRRIQQQQYQTEVKKILAPEQNERYIASETEREQFRGKSREKGPRPERAPRQ